MKWIARALTFAVLLALLFTLPAAAPARAYATDGFEIMGYDVQAVVSEDNVYAITETIDVHFTEDKHGIYRAIPVDTVMTRDSVSTRVHSWVTDVSVEGYDYSVNRASGNVTIKIGSRDELVSGDHTYVISYKLHFGSDGVQDFDEAYFNIIGTEWTTMIDIATFSVTLPESFDPEKLGFSMGYEGMKGYNPDDLEFFVEGRTITGRVLHPLYAGEGLTMRLELPQGYFDMSHDFSPDWILVILFGLFAAAGTMLFLLFGIDRRPVVTVEFFPPENMTPAELGFVNDGYADTRDVISLIVYWADQGCLAITPESDGYRLTQLRLLPDSAPPFERHMFERLFERGPEVKTDQLKNSFYKTVAETTGMIGKEFEPEEKRIFTRQSMKAQPYISFMSALPVLITLVTALSRTEMGFWVALIIGLMFGVFLLAPMFWFIGLLRRWRGKTPVRRTVSLTLSLCVWAGTIAVFTGITSGLTFIPALPWIAVACTFLLAAEAVFIRKRTPRGTALLGKAEGFARFIAYAEKDRIEKLAEQYPHYFYRILPYAYALGITDRWVKNFEGIATPPPDWYHADWQSTGFSSAAFLFRFNSAMSNISSQMTSAPSSSGSGGGGFSGGGSSGGGGGGGGGGSW